MFNDMFSKRMVYMAPPGEGPKQNVEKKDAAAAKDKIESKMPKMEQIDNTVDQESKRTDGAARADIIAMTKQGKGFDANLSKMLGAENLEKVKAGLKNLPAGENMATKRMEVGPVTVMEKGKEVEKTLYFASIADKGTVKMFYKLGEDFSPNGRTFVSNLEDPDMLDLVGGKGLAAKERMELRKKEAEDAKSAFDVEKAKYDVSKKTPADQNALKKAEIDYNKAKNAYDGYQELYKLALAGKKVGASKTA